MASDDEEIEQIDDELARVEEEIRELEEEEDLPEPEAPEPGAGIADAPEPEEAFEGEPDVEEEDSLVSRLTSKFRSPETEEGEVTDGEKADEADEDEGEDDGGLLGGLIGSEDQDDETTEEGEPGEDEDEDDEAPEETSDAGDDEPPEPEPAEEAADDETDPQAETDTEASTPGTSEPDTEDEPEEADEEPPDEEDLEAEDGSETDEDEDEDDGFLAGLTGRFGSEDDETTEDAEADTEEGDDDGDGLLGGLTGSEDQDDETTEEGEPGEDEDEDAGTEEGDDGDGLLGGLIGSGDDEDEDETEDEAPEEAGTGDRQEASDTDEAADPDEEPLEDEQPGEEPLDEGEDPGEGDDEENRKRAAALLARFQGEDDGDPEGSVPPGAPSEDDEEDEDRRRGVIVGAVVVVLLLAVAAVAAFLYLGDGGADASTGLEANLVADSFQNDEGSYVAVTGDAVRFDASASQGSVDEYRWAFGDGQTETTSDATVEHVYQSAGSYTIELTLVGPDDEAQSALSVVVVEAPQAQPELLVGGEPAAEPGTVGNNAFVGQSVTLDGSGSTADPEHTLTSYTWDTNGDGSPEATGQEAEVSFDQAGRWLVDLAVKDDLGNEDNQTQPLHVSRRVVHNDTIGPSGTEPATQSFNASVIEGRLAAQPVELNLRLTYNTSSDGTGGLPVQPEVQSDLDLNVTSPDGTEFTAEDDSGQGEETLTIPEADLNPLGAWNATITQDTQESPTGSTNEAQYELVIETIY